MSFRKKTSLTTQLNPMRTKRTTVVILLLAGVIGLGAVGFVATASKRSSLMPEASVQPAQAEPRLAGSLRARLMRQPAAARMSVRLGGRFSRTGLEISTLEGTLSFGGEVRPVRIVRTQRAEGEEVEILVAGEARSRRWSAETGARFNGGQAIGSEKKLIERLVLDSPDQFILAQLREAGYRAIAQNVVPVGIVDLETYAGPVWDVVRVDENDSSLIKPLSHSRFYYIRTSTGLIDKVVSEEEGGTIVAEFSSWSDQNGERLPLVIRWRQREQLLMEFNVNSRSHGPRR